MQITDYIGSLEAWELASYLVTVVAFPFAIVVFVWEKRREYQQEEEEIYQKLSDEYSELQQLLLQNADLFLYSKAEIDETAMTPEQIERRLIIFDLIISLFERAYILVYENDMNGQQKRLWASWHDYMKNWCRRKDFKAALPELLQGEDEDFKKYLCNLAQIKCP
ncbi:MAG: hypothetical protein K0R29_803 [Pseudobdellovibrio sp.]|jgi:hypothetical protein|nr:hypothetical protein [Pseudobdellovibrio sp.]